MKALFFDAADEGKTIPRASRSPPTCRPRPRRWREQLFDVLTAHDDQDRLTSAYLEGQRDRRRRRSAQVLREQTLRG